MSITSLVEDQPLMDSCEGGKQGMNVQYIEGRFEEMKVGGCPFLSPSFPCSPHRNRNFLSIPSEVWSKVISGDQRCEIVTLRKELRLGSRSAVVLCSGRHGWILKKKKAQLHINLLLSNIFTIKLPVSFYEADNRIKYLQKE